MTGQILKVNYTLVEAWTQSEILWREMSQNNKRVALAHPPQMQELTKVKEESCPNQCIRGSYLAIKSMIF